MSASPFRGQALLAYFVLLAGVFGFLSVPPSIGLGLQSNQASTTFTACTVTGQGDLTVHVVDAEARPVAGATVLLNGTYFVNGPSQVCLSNLSGTTDSDGNAVFSVPSGKYNVTVIPPPSLAGASIAVSQITAPPPTMFATTTVTVPEFPITSTTTSIGNGSVLLMVATLFGVACVLVYLWKHKSTNPPMPNSLNKQPSTE